MNPKNMTGEPNQQCRPSVLTGITGFNLDAYSRLNPTPFMWDKASSLQAQQCQDNNAFASTSTGFPTFQHPQQQILPQFEQRQQQPFLSNYVPAVQQTIVGNYGMPNPISGSFAFGTPDSRPSYPVQFPFPSTNSQFGSRAFQSSVRGKRKTDSPPPVQSKQHITEEKMAEHMSKLHINSETAVPDESESTRTKRLYMCEEMRKLQNDSILPQSLLDRMSKPCTALVLWTPPPRIFPVLSLPDENQNSTESIENSVPSNTNNMENDDEIEVETESNVLANQMDFDL